MSQPISDSRRPLPGGGPPDQPEEDRHPFIRAPHQTLFAMSLPLLLSLVAEPLTGLVDTAFVSRLGSADLAAVGVGTTALTSIFWAFSFLGVGTQTDVATALGRRDIRRANQVGTIALLLGLIIGVLLILMLWPFSSGVVTFMGAAGAMHGPAVAYFKIRLLGAPAVLITLAAFGILRGLQDMQSPLKVAVGMNAVNIGLDALLIFGWGPVPGMGVFGAGLASTISQWIGAVWAILAIFGRGGITRDVRFRDCIRLFRIGGDLFIRTGLLTLFLLLTTRTATLMGPDSGAAHQALRQFWLFTALFLDAYAIAGQSLVGYFAGAGDRIQVRRVAEVVAIWSVGIGLLLSLVMTLARSAVAGLLVPEAALAVFGPAWTVTCWFQPLNALAFGTDGIHWGTGDFAFLRNVMILASLSGASALALMPDQASLTLIWLITGGWIAIRAGFGLARIWPGIGDSPFSSRPPEG